MGNRAWITFGLVKIFGISIGIDKWNNGLDITILILCFILNINTSYTKSSGKKSIIEFYNGWIN